MAEKNQGQKGYVRRNSGTSVTLSPQLDEFTEWKTVAEIRGSQDGEEQILSAFISAFNTISQDVLNPSGGGPRFIDGQAHIQFGLGGVNMDIYCDIVVGGLVALPASYMRVSVRLAPGTPADIITLRGGISENVRPGTINPQLTFKQGAIPALTNGTLFPVPPFARRVHALITPFAAIAGASLQFNQGNALVAESAIPPSAAQAAAIPNDVSRIAIRAGVVPIVGARFIYELQT